MIREDFLEETLLELRWKKFGQEERICCVKMVMGKQMSVDINEGDGLAEPRGR